MPPLPWFTINIMVLKISPLEVIRGLFLGELNLWSPESKRLIESGWHSSGIAFGLAVPTLILLSEFVHGHSHGEALAFEILGLLAGSLSLVVLPSMSGFIQFVPIFMSVADNLFTCHRIILFQIEKLPGFSVISEILITGEEWINGCCLGWYSRFLPLQAILGGLWVAVYVVGIVQQGHLYPVPKDYQGKKASGCQFLPCELFPFPSPN